MTYFDKMMRYAKQAQGITNIDYRVVLAQWHLETGGGTSSLSIMANNHAGIKSNSQGRDGIQGRYASYKDLTNFTKDYSRVMMLPYYTKVREARGLEAQVKALHESPWAEDPNYDKKLMAVINNNNLGTIIPGMGGGGSFDIKGVLDILKSPLVLGGLALIILFKK